MEEPVLEPVNIHGQHKPGFERLNSFLVFAPVWILFILVILLVVLLIFGPNWAFVPGDLGDGRFNNYILEHFFLWVRHITTEYWNASFFYPYQNTIAFSDNLLGSAPIYAAFRWFGLDRETSFQWWYLCSFIFNYTAAVYVLLHAKLKPLAIGIGAFFFTFGIPLLAQETHTQLFYRFGIPLACFFLLEFFSRPTLTRLAAVTFWLVWQFYLSIYIGFFLVMLLVALSLLIPLLETELSIRKYFLQWPRQLKQAWLQADLKERTFSLLVIGVASVCFFALLWPYYKVSIDYGFSRDWLTVSGLLPVPQSFLLADNSLIWNSLSAYASSNTWMRPEHQLFPGLAVSTMVVLGLIFLFKTKNSTTAWLYFWAGVLLIIVTLNFNGYSIYWLIWKIPGINSIRAVTRIQLVLMWPLAFFVAWVVDGAIQRSRQKARWLYTSVLLLTVLLVAESTFFTHVKYSKADSLSRLVRITQMIPARVPKDPILAVAYTENDPGILTDIDAMLAAQELGWPTLNGYSGNIPPGYSPMVSCKQIPSQITAYFEAVNMKKEERLAFYLATMERIVPVGFRDCNSSWWKKCPDQDCPYNVKHW